MDNGLNSRSGRRIEVIDALRGFAIAAIMVIHSSNNFLYSSGRVEELEWLAQLDVTLKKALYFMVEGKAYAIFALLFGFTYALQLSKQQAKGGDFGWRMVWRMVLLFGFGAFNAIFFAGGDPLMFYALAMLLIIPIRNISSSALITIALLLFLQPIEIANAISPMITNLHYHYYAILAEAVKEGNFFDMAATNMVAGEKGALLWALETGRFTQTLALFILGMWLYRKEFVFEPTEKLIATAKWLTISTTTLMAVKLTIENPVLNMIYNLSFALLIAILFVIVFRRYSSHKIFKLLQNYGKLSLSNFIMQSIIGSFIFYPWGLNLAAHVGSTISIGIGVAVVLVQIGLSNLWIEKVSKKGVLERLWHYLTWI